MRSPMDPSHILREIRQKMIVYVEVTEECEEKSVPCDQAQVAISGAQLLLVLCVSGDVAVGGLLLVLVEDVCWMP